MPVLRPRWMVHFSADKLLTHKRLPDQPRNRTIRSFVRRQSRITSGQNQALELFWHDYGLDFSCDCLDLTGLFSRSAPKILDIGSGMGETTVKLAFRYPENDYLAVEVYRPGIGNLIRQAAISKITNIKVICHDVIKVLQYQIPSNSIDTVQMFFPDPWPKKRHRKRRLVNDRFLELLKPRLKMNAAVFLATDWEDLAIHMLNTCDKDAGLINLAGKGNFSPRPVWRPQTKFEMRGSMLKHQVWDLSYCRSLR